ncbi:TPA: hypothetical protein O2F94_000225 [Staphylococcus aureus]|nr:hypothetical protein [Staphylococcus aureus]HCY9873742.1 hypothetical protein [Staphylococcus aureus]
MTEFNPITTLKINDGEKDYEVEAKVTFAFDRKAEKFSEDSEDGRKVAMPGFNVIFNGLLESRNKAILQFWECATAYLKNPPTREQLEKAIDDFITENEDTLPLLQGALDKLNNSGFFKRESRSYWMTLNKAPNMAKSEDKEMTKAGIEMMKENYEEIMGAEPYTITQK